MRQLLHLDSQVVDERLHLWVPSTEVRGGHLEGGDTVVMLVAEGVDADGLQIGNAPADGVRRVGAGELDGVEAFVDGGIVGGAGKIEISKVPLPLLVVLVETTSELFLQLLDFL